MIRKIKLNNFGKFKEKEFELSDITVFYGKNESGKTTIFDGLMIKLTDVKGNDTLGKKLRRYGNVNRKENIVIEPDNKEKIPAEIFANILAIRAGEITLNLANKEFSKEISNKIMASEVNLSLLKSKIDKKANVNNNNYLLNKDKNELYDELKKLNSEIYNNINKIKENEILELELKKLSFLLLDKTKKYEEKKVRFSNIENEIKILNKAQELRNITDNLRKIIEYENIEKDIENNKDIEDREVENYSSVEKEILAIEKEIELKKKQLEELRKEFDILEERKKSLSASRLSLNDIEEANIEIKKAEQNLKKNPFYLIFASIVIVLAITFTIFFKNPVLLTLLTLTFIPIFLLIQNKNNIKLSLQKFLTLFPELKDKDFTEIFKILEKIKFEVSTSSIKTQELTNKLDELRLKEKVLTTEIENLNNNRNTMDNNLKDFLFSQQVKSLKELYEKKTSTISLKKQMEKLKNEIFTNFPEANSLEDLKKDLIIRKSQIEAEGISLTDYKDGLLNKMNIEKEELYREIEREKEEIVEIKSKISENRGKLSNITEILDKYARLKQEISDKENNLKKIIKSQSAYQKLSSIVSDMINDVTMIFNQISKEISDEFSDFFPHFKGIEIKSIDKIDDFYLNDKYEEKRSIDHLSSGTRDMFLLAFRTLLAKKFGIGNFLIFDEPFMALDQERIETMLKILKRFYDNYKWQFIFLTKDPQLKNLIIKQFGEKVKVEELE